MNTTSESIEQVKRKTIVRVVHNRENPFVQLNRHAIWDKNLSLKAVGLWARCMAQPDDWTFCIKELVSRCKEGRESVGNAMKELIEAGYVLRIDYQERGKKGRYTTYGTEYVFFEFPATQEEKDFQTDKFKKSFQNTGFQNPGNPHLLIRNKTEKEEDIKKEEESSLKVPKEPLAAKAAEMEASHYKKNLKGEFSDQVKALTHRLIEYLKRTKTDYSPPNNLSPLMSHVDFMLRLDKRDPEKLCDVFQWALADSFWADKMFKPNPAKYLREKFDQLDMKMNAKPPEKERRFAPCSDKSRMKRAIQEMNEGAL